MSSREKGRLCFRNKLAHRKSQPILEHKGEGSVVHIQQCDWPILFWVWACLTFWYGSDDAIEEVCWGSPCMDHFGVQFGQDWGKHPFQGSVHRQSNTIFPWCRCAIHLLDRFQDLGWVNFMRGVEFLENPFGFLWNEVQELSLGTTARMWLRGDVGILRHKGFEIPLHRSGALSVILHQRRGGHLFLHVGEIHV